ERRIHVIDGGCLGVGGSGGQDGGAGQQGGERTREGLVHGVSRIEGTIDPCVK
nr:hypothetical protein [Tanacetum cinerariifolium]